MKALSLERLRPALLFSFVIAVLLMACTAQNPSGPGAVPEIRIGVIVYSDEEVERLSTVNAADMAVGEVNEDGGLDVRGVKHKVTWIREDMRGGVPEESVKAVRKLINQSAVVAVIGPQYSVDAIPGGEIAEKSGIPLIAPISTNPQTTLNRKYVFRMGFLDDLQGRVAAHYLLGDLGFESFAVLYNVANPYSRTIADVFSQTVSGSGKGRIVAFESYTTDDTDLTPQLLRIRESDPQVLYLPNFSEETTRIAIKAREMGIHSILVGADGWDRADFSTRPEFDGAFMTAHYSADIATARNKTFVKNYQARYGVIPGDTAALTYDAFRLVFAAIEDQGKADPESIRDGLYSMGPFEGVGGRIDFVDTGDPEKGVVILRFAQGKVNVVGVIPSD